MYNILRIESLVFYCASLSITYGIMSKVHEGTAAWKEVRITDRREARLRCKEPTQAAPTGLVCHICKRPCKVNKHVNMLV